MCDEGVHLLVIRISVFALFISVFSPTSDICIAQVELILYITNNTSKASLTINLTLNVKNLK